MELFLDSPLAELELEECRRAVRLLSVLTAAVTIAAVAAVAAVVIATGVLW